jgi:NAD(P)-dependent dehydrogenase (short-subunit alcohol dehydrogenase family)
MDTSTETEPVAMVTGGSRGLGLAIAHELVGRGWSVVVDARDGDALRRAALELGEQVIAVEGDVADPGHRADVMRAVARFGRLLDRYPQEELERVFRVNVHAPLALIQLALPYLVASSGIVIDVTSDAAVEPYERWGGYGASKAALDQITAVLAAEQSAISVYAFDPGDMRTQMHQAAFPGEDISDRPLPEMVVPALMALINNRPPSGRYRASDLLARTAGPS